MEKSSAVIIENCWCCYRDRQMFKLLKYAISAADHSLTYDIMKKINPAEAELFKDPAFQAIIRFRFAGVEFPPHIVFKVFIKTNGQGVKYLSGKKTIKPASHAAIDSCQLMGNRKFMDQMISDLCEENQLQVNDELDVTNHKDYMKYLSRLDEMSALTGGKGNSWRTLNLDSVPRQHIIYDVLTYLNRHTKTDRFLQYLHSRRFQPPTQAQQLEYINMLSHKKLLDGKKSEPSRRSKKAVERVEKMRKMYQSPDKLIEATAAKEMNDQDCNENFLITQQEQTIYDSPVTLDRTKLISDVDLNDSSWDEEGKLLFEWTQNLSMENVFSR